MVLAAFKIYSIFFILGYNNIKQLIKGSDSMTNSNRVPNRLAQEKSPYLLQHAYNPLDWYPWSEKTFK
ncbi:hypothetical protein K154306013_07870 [Clostridium tetani]|nr:hypothetical protein K154306013_07870 [Clostridium tetani]